MAELRIENSVWMQVALLGGFGIVFYYFLGMFVCCLTETKFENYLASELFSIAEIMEGDEQSTASSKMTMKRGSTSSGFHNEIFGKDEEILNRGIVGCSYNLCRILSCCCSPKRRIDLAFEKARSLTNQELNITSMIKAQRQNTALCEIMKRDERTISKAVKRRITLSDEEGEQVNDEEDPKRV